MQRLPIVNRFFRKPKPVKIEDGSDILAWELRPDGHVLPIKQGSGWYGSGVGMGPNAFTETAIGAGVALTQSTFGWGAAYSQSTWVYRCVEVRKNSINRIPFYIYNKRTGRRIPNHPLLMALAHNKQQIFKKIEQSQILFGESFLEPAKNEYGYYSTIYWLNNLGMAVLIGAGHITGYSYTALQGGMAQNFDYDDIAFMKTDNPFNDLRGMSMLEVAMDEIRIDFDVARVVRAYYANDTRIGVVIIPKKDMNDADSLRFMDLWKMQNQGPNNAGKPILAPSDVTISRIQNPATLDDMNLRESTRREICGALGVPLSLAGGWDDAKYQSLPEQRKSFYEETIIPECENIADFINIELMPFYEDGERCAFAYDFTVVLALTEDAQRKGDMYSQRLTSGGITRAEYRRAMGHDAKPEDEVYYIPAGVTVVSANETALVKPQTNEVVSSPQAETQPTALPTPPVKPNAETPNITDTQTEQTPQKQLPGNVFSARAPQPTIPAQLIPGKAITAIQVKQETPEEELAAWEKKALNSNPFKALSFTCFVTPPEVQTVVRAALTELGKDAPKAAIRAVFRAAKDVMNKPPAEMYDAWKDYDGLMTDIGRAWAADYMAKVLPSILAVTNGEPTPIELQSALDAHHDALMADLLGTEEKPGAIVKLIMSGMAAGNASLVRGSAANPKRPMLVKAIEIDWQLLAKEAFDFAKQYIFDLIRNVDATTQKYVQEAVSKWIASGEPLDSLKRDLEAIFHDPTRADNIAETESARAFVTGATERYQRSEVKMVRLKPLNDSLVCEICLPLEGTVVALSEGWQSATGAKYPPFHPRCRHWFVPADDEEGI